MAALGGSLPAGGAISSPVQRARRLLGNLALDPAERYARYVQIFDGEQRNALYTDEFSAALGGSHALETIVAPWQAASGLDVRDIMLEVDSATYLSGDLIAKIDIATMAHALEARSPLLDHEVLELAAALPAELKVRGREKKWILRRAMRGWIPDEILDRPKQGFSVPVSDWLRDELSAWAREVLLDRGTLARGWFRERSVRDMLGRHAAGWDAEAPRIWSLLVLELWQREVVERRAEPVESLLPV
jgi:asparagine synthase (glutamine-hydrolysing)